MRRASIKRHNIRYSPRYIYAGDYALWVQMLQKGLQLWNIPDVVTEYRLSSGQISSARSMEQARDAALIRDEALRFRNGCTEEATDLTALHVPATGNRLSLIIPFLNEGDEVKQTVASARRFAGSRVDIIVINDYSNDGYDYRSSLQGLNVTYIYNGERKGVAASRDLGVQLCTTPYFLLLDAHMRFYDNRWPERIVEMLEEDDRRILCCQTHSLTKNEAGVVTDLENETASFGAYMPLRKGKYLPDIQWSLTEMRPGEPTEPIAAVLGAGYAASKRYWHYLRGLQGLLYYGCDEIYLSLKAWLEGGECQLLKDVVIGHIYRKSSPFHHYTDAEVYNYLFIAELLFPPSLRGPAFATARLLDGNAFHSAMRLLKEKETQIDDLKAYYRQILTTDFSKVLQLNRERSGADVAGRLKPAERISEVANFVSTHPATGFGLCDGKMGQLLWMLHCMGGHEAYDAFSAQLWTAVFDALKEQRLPFNFKHGLAGIGWALVYLHEKGFIEDDIGEPLQYIDRQLAAYHPEDDDDRSLQTGSGGWLAYRLATLKYRQKQTPTPLVAGQSERMLRMANMLIEKSNDWAVLSYAFQVKWFLKNPGEEATTLELHDWMEFKDFVPRNTKYWSSALTGNVLSTTLYAKLIKENAYE